MFRRGGILNHFRQNMHRQGNNRQNEIFGAIPKPFQIGLNLLKENKFNFNANPHIFFSRPEMNRSNELTEYLTSPNQERMIYLFNPAYNFNAFEFIKNTFTIITTNGSYKFNIDILKDTSQTIKNFLKENPQNFQYKLKTKDDKNLMEKIEKLYSGEPINIFPNENTCFNEIIDELNLYKCFKKNAYNFNKPNNEIVKSKNNYQINLRNFSSFLKETIPKTFTICTNKKEYNCNDIGINSSKILKEFLSKNPNTTKYEFNYDDEFGEFQSICDFFNFNFVKLTADNINSINSIAKELQIDFILNDIENFIDEFDKRIQTIDEQQSIIDSINELFDILYNIKSITVNGAKDKIINSKWIETDESVQELAAFIIQTITTNFILHPYLADLIEMLDKEANESNKLKNLIPFIVEKLMFFFGREKLNNFFVFTLYNRGLIQKDKIIMKLEKIFLKQSSEKRFDHEFYDSSESLILFIPEIYEILSFNLPRLLKFFPNISHNFISMYLPQKVELFKEMRERGSPDDPLTKSLRSDDVDTLQSIISTNKFDLINSIVPYNAFEDFILNGKTNLINYAAAYGSLKCFKYLLVNHANLNNLSFLYAIYGGNIEIIKITERHEIKDIKPGEIWQGFTIESTNLELFEYAKIIPTVKMHQNKLFDWIFEQKIQNSIQNKELISLILAFAAGNGNCHAIASIVDKGFDFSSFDDKTCKDIIQSASRLGYYKLLEFLSIIMKDKIERIDGVFDIQSSTEFGNLSIFKFYNERIKDMNYNKALSIAVKRNYIKIAEYIFENFKDKLTLKSDIVYDFLSDSIKISSNYLFEYIHRKCKEIDDKIFDKFDKKYIRLLSEACYLKKEMIAKTIINLINENNNVDDDGIIDFSLPFYNAVASGSVELCQFLIDKKVYINYDKISVQIQKLSRVKKEIFDIILKNINPFTKQTILTLYLKESIASKNKDLIKYLLNENAFCIEALIEAVKTGDIEIVDLVLSKNSKPSFVNQISIFGTALNVAVQINNLPIIKRLLSIPGIDPSLARKGNITPFVEAVKNFNVNAMNEILDFYGPNIKSQTKQLDEAVKVFLAMISNDKKNISKPKSVSVLKRLIEIDSIDLNFYNDNFTPLIFACIFNEIEIVKTMIKMEKVDVNLYLPNSGDTPLITAISNNNIEIAKLLINCERTNINQNNYKNETALTISVLKNLTELVDIIINDEKFDLYESRLNYAFYLSSGEIFMKLIELKDLDVNYRYILKTEVFEHFKDDTSMVNFNDVITSELIRTPLIIAITNSRYDLADLILNHPSFDPFKSFIKEAIFMACRKHNIDIDIFYKMLKFIDYDINIQNELGHSLFEVAFGFKNRILITEILKNEKFDSRKSNLKQAFIKNINFDNSMKFLNEIFEFDKKHDNLIDFKKNLPNGKTYFTHFYNVHNSNSTYKYINFLLENGADPNAPDKEGIYPLQYAINIDCYEYVHALIDSGKIDFSIKLPEGKTYLHLAAKTKINNILQLFLKLKIYDVNVTDSNGDTPLIDACREKRFMHIKRLFEIDDLDYNHCNNEGDDALKVFCRSLGTSTKMAPKTKDEYFKALQLINHNHESCFLLNFSSNKNESKFAVTQHQVNKMKNKDSAKNGQSEPALDSKNQTCDSTSTSTTNHPPPSPKRNDKVNSMAPLSSIKKFSQTSSSTSTSTSTHPSSVNSMAPLSTVKNISQTSSSTSTSTTNHPPPSPKRNDKVNSMAPLSPIKKFSQTSSSTSTSTSTHPSSVNSMAPLSTVKKFSQVSTPLTESTSNIMNDSKDVNSSSLKETNQESQQNDDSLMQDEIISAIKNTLEGITREQASKISSCLSSIAEKRAKKITDSFFEELKQKNQIESTKKTQEEEFKEKDINNKQFISQKEFLIQKLENEFEYDDFDDDQNQLESQNELSFYENQMNHQWNLMIQMNNMRNMQFNMAMQQQEQMMRSMENNKKSSSSKRKSKKKKNNK